MAPPNFPCDLDTTSLSLTILEHDDEATNTIMDEMLEHRNEDGIVLVRVPFNASLGECANKGTEIDILRLHTYSHRSSRLR